MENILVLCEVFHADGVTPVESNTRAFLRDMLDQTDGLGAWVGFEQEYTLFEGSKPLGFPSERRFPPAQGPYYCGVGADEVSGRALVEKHLELCLKAGLPLTGINAEVMPGQWEFQVFGDALEASDSLWLARWLLYRIGEDFGISATLDPKPVAGDWNGAGMHTNFSTTKTRANGGLRAIESILSVMGQPQNMERHLNAYGDGYEIRLTGHHETCRYDEFKWGVSDRTASVRIPLQTANDGMGYFEDRRPNANADPYKVVKELIYSTLLS
jgi:glutamine synthetase